MVARAFLLALPLLLATAAPVRADDDLAALLRFLKEAKAAGAPKAPPAAVVEVRLPTWETGAVVANQAFGGAPMRLTDKELLAATSVYQDALDLDAVRVVAVSVSNTETPQTWGNVIRVPAGTVLGVADVIHELAHVWQYQTRGTGYLSNSLLDQACAVVRKGDRAGAYAYKLEEGKSLLSYGAEQQAQIIQDFYGIKGLSEDKRYTVLIAELRRTKAVKGGTVVLAEADAGLPPRAKELPLPASLGPLPNVAPTAGVAPQLEIRFSPPW